MLLLDTHLILWAAYAPDKLSETARGFIADTSNTLAFSAASIWEVAIKSALNRPDFSIDAALLRRALGENGYRELPISSIHAAAVSHLPAIHSDPFDRILIAQAQTEGIALLTNDRKVAKYGSPTQLMA